jgi:hypothetical protein
MSGTRGIGVSCLAVILLACAGCADQGSVPSGILPPNKMQTVMWDMVQADQYAVLYVAKDSAAHRDTKTETLKLYEEVFRLHDVSREEFRKSYQYYLDHPVLNQLLFDSLISQGNRVRTESYSRPGIYRPPPVIPPHLPAGAKLQVPGGKLFPGRAPMPGGTPPHSTMPGLHPAVLPPAKAQKDSVRKHS